MIHDFEDKPHESHIIIAILLNCARPGESEQIRICFYSLFFQLFTILAATLASFLRSQLSSSDALFAVTLMLSPSTMHLFSLAPIKPNQWFKRPVHANTVYIVLTVCLFVAVYVISIVHLVATDCRYLGLDPTRMIVNPITAIISIFCLVFHILQISRTYILRCAVQLWYLPYYPYNVILGFATTLPLSLQMFGVWNVPGVRDEWRDCIGSWFVIYKWLIPLILYHRDISASVYGFHGAQAVHLGHRGDNCQCCDLGMSNHSTLVYEYLQPRNYISRLYNGQSMRDLERITDSFSTVSQVALVRRLLPIPFLVIPWVHYLFACQVWVLNNDV